MIEKIKPRFHFLPIHLKKLQGFKRKLHHPLQHHIHKKHNISKKTLFYVKEYGPHSHVTRVIIKESLFVLLMASIISSFGGFALEQIKTSLIMFVPFVILLPALNDMIGDFGTIISSKFSTYLHEGKVDGHWMRSKEFRMEFLKIMIVATITGVISTGIALIISQILGYDVTTNIALKIFGIVVLDVLLLVSILCMTAIYAGRYFYKKKEDPNNFLIPITTSIADFGNMIVLTALIVLLF